MVLRQIPLLGAIRGLRSFYFGYIAFLIPLFLKQVGFSVVEIGIYALVATIASSGLVLLSGFMGDLLQQEEDTAHNVWPAGLYIRHIPSHT